MNRRIIGVLGVGSLLAAVGCGERERPLPGPPLASKSSGTLSCSFTAMNPLVSRYFSSGEAQSVRSILSAMQTALSTGDLATARDSAFSVMAHIESNVAAGNTDSVDASSLTNNLLVCVYSNPADLPATFPETFQTATNPNSQGAYGVRGGNVSTPVFSRPMSSPFSGIAPPFDTTFWSTVLHLNPPPRRVLLYGQPGSTPNSYDWKVIPRSDTLDPQVVVGLCLNASTLATSMVNQQNVGFITFVDPWFLSEPTEGACSPNVTLSRGWKPVMFARGLARRAVEVLEVRPLWATAALSPGGLGGSTGGIHSVFKSQAVSGVTLTFTQSPRSVVAVLSDSTSPEAADTFSAQVKATDATTGQPVGGVTISLDAVNNNGVPASLFVCNSQLTLCTSAMPPGATTSNAGIANFILMAINKTGAYKLVVVDRSVTGRDAIAVGSAISAKFNVKP